MFALSERCGSFLGTVTMVTLTLIGCCFVLKRISFTCAIFFGLHDNPPECELLSHTPMVKAAREAPV